MDKTIIVSTASMAGLGLFFASVLAFVNQKLKVKEDPKVEKIVRALPGVNCGACGFTNCHQYAEALAKGQTQADLCRAGGAEVIKRLSAIQGVEVTEKVKEIAIVHCGADESKREKKANYSGIKTCQAAHNTFGGETLCSYGCLGYGDCMKACPFDAITMIKGLPVIDRNKCTACRKCVISCPRKIITVEKMESEKFAYVACNNLDKGADAKKTCPVACIACGLCQKLTDGVFNVENNLAKVQYDKIKNIENLKEVASKCPTKCIYSF